MVAKNASGLDDPVNASQGGTGANTFDGARTNMGLNPTINAQTIGYTAVSADRGRLIHYTGAGGVTLALTAAATLGNGWNVVVRNDADTAITIDPNGAETIDGAATLALDVGQAVTIYCTGATFYTLGQASVDNFGANVELSNLAGVAINASLVPGADASIDLGSAAERFRNALVESVQTGIAGAQTTVLQAYDTMGAAYTTFATMTAGNPPTMSLASAVTAVTQAAADGSTKISTTAYADRMLPLAGGTMTGTLTLAGDPVAALQAATKQYVDAIASGIEIKTPCYAGSTADVNAVYLNGAAGVGATLTNAGALAAFSVDGTSPPINSRILVKNQAATLQNGIYTLTTVGSGAVAWVLTRATDYDQPAEITVGSLVIVQNGTVNAVTSWIQTDTVTTVGVDPIEFTQFSAGIGANTALSNLAAVAINTALLPGADGTIDLGSAADRFRNALVEAVQTGTGAAQTTVLQAYDTMGAAYTTFATLTANNPPTMNLASAVTATTQAASDNSTKLATTAYSDNQVTTIAANKALSNLAAVAINTALIPGADGTIDLGTAADWFRNYIGETVQTGTTAAQTMLLQAYDTLGAAYTTFGTLTANNPPTMSLASAVTATTQAALDNSTKLATTAYVDAATGGGSGANVHLSNLAAVAINTALLPGADGTIDLGSAADRFRNYIGETVQTGTTATQSMLLQAYDTLGAAYTTFATLTANNPPTMSLASAVTATTQAASDNSTKLATTAYADNQVSTISANKALSNLASVAINTALVPGADGTIDLGTAAHRFRNYIGETVQTGTTAAQTILLQAYDTLGAAYTTFATLTANNPPTMSLASAVTATTQSASDNSTKLATTAYCDNQVGSISANKALSNLASVAINTSLLPGADNAIDLGDGTHRFRELYGSRVAPGTTSGNTLILSARNVGGASDTAFFTLTSDTTTPTAVLASSVTGTTQSPADNSTKLATTAYADAAAAAVAPVYPTTLAHGGTNANLTASNGGIFYSTGSAGAILSGTATALQMLQSGASGAPAWSTATYPATTTVNRILYSSAANVVDQITTANSSVLVTDGSGVPSLGTALPNGITATTQSASDNSTKVATTAYADAIAAGSGSIILIASSTTAGAATINFDNKLSATYDNYMLVWENLSPATNGVTGEIRIGTGGTPTYQTSTYNGAVLIGTGASAASVASSASFMQFTLASRWGNASNTGGGGSAILSGVNSASYKSITGVHTSQDTTAGIPSALSFAVQWQTTTVLTSVQFLTSSGNIVGTIKLYGIKN